MSKSVREILEGLTNKIFTIDSLIIDEEISEESYKKQRELAYTQATIEIMEKAQAKQGHPIDLFLNTSTPGEQVKAILITDLHEIIKEGCDY